MTIANRRFGIEIEIVGTTRDRVIEAFRAAGLACESQSYNHEVCAAWKLVDDGSLSRGGFEVVSPILCGEEGVAEVVKAAHALVEAGAQANNTCGLHVHVDARGMSTESIVNVARRYARFETEIESWMPRARNQNSTYCRQVRGTNFDELMRAAGARFEYTDRGRVNLGAMARHGTIEFRHHAGTTSAEKMENWIRFCVGFLEASIIAPAPVATVTAETPATPPVVPTTTDTLETMAAALFAGHSHVLELSGWRNWLTDRINSIYGFEGALSASRYEPIRERVRTFVEAERALRLANRNNPTTATTTQVEF